jgi:putative ABC transport system permease protein
MAMRPSDLLRGARHTFSANKVRVLLTLTGIVIGAGAMVLLAGLLVAGEEALVRLSQQANESDMVEVTARDAPKDQQHRTTRPLTVFDAEALDENPLLSGARVTPAARLQTDAFFEGRQKRTSIMSTELDSPSLYRLEIERGRGLVESDFAERRRVAVVGQEMWTELLQKRPNLNDVRLRVDGVTVEVVGVLAHKPTMGAGNGTWMWNRRTLVPSTTFRSVWAPEGAVRNLYVRLKGAVGVRRSLSTITTIVENTLLRRHHGVKNFEVKSDARGQDQEELILRIIQIMLFGTGVVALFVGGINIMNILLVTVTERTKEIGVRRALGATPTDIALQFLLEAALLSGVGGLLGVFGGVAMTWLAAQALTALLGPWRFVIELWSIGLALGMATVTGLVFGLMPALRAAKLNVVDALRTD